MTDYANLIERLRQTAGPHMTPGGLSVIVPICDEAADAVETLTAEVAQWRDSIATESLRERAEAAEAARDRLAAALEAAGGRMPDPMHPEFPRQFVDAQCDALAIISEALAAVEKP